MIGVAQVIGMKPTLRSFFSGAPALREDFGRRLEAGKTATAPPARSTHRPISGRRAAPHPAETSRASRRRRRRPRSASPRSRRARSATPSGLLMLCRGLVLATGTAGSKVAVGIKRIVERGHRTSCASLRGAITQGACHPLPAGQCLDDAALSVTLGHYENS